MIDHRLHLWRLYDATQSHSGGCSVCGDDDEFSPDIEGFEETGVLLCSLCFEAQCEAESEEAQAMEKTP